MWVDECEYESFCNFGGSAEESDGTVRGRQRGVFVGFRDGDDDTMLPDVGYCVV